jgi:hypothetical protein
MVMSSESHHHSTTPLLPVVHSKSKLTGCSFPIYTILPRSSTVEIGLPTVMAGVDNRQ